MSRYHLVSWLTLSEDMMRVHTRVKDADHPWSKHISINNIQQHAELAVLAPTVATASTGHMSPDVTCSTCLKPEVVT